MGANVINLKGLLEQKKITLYRLCQDTGLSYQQGFAIANNRTKKIEFNTIETLCNYLSCEVSELIHIRPRNSVQRLQRVVAAFPLTKNAKRESSTHENSGPKPFLQWVGGKRSLLPHYEEFFPKKFNRYIEPFLGGGAVFFHLSARRALLNDSNPELISTYEGVRDTPEEVIRLLQLLKERHSPELYQAMRNLDRDAKVFSKLQTYEVAARMIYLNQTCFNGVYRINRHGQFNVPIGSSLNRLICDEHTIRSVSKNLKNTQITCADFSDALQKARKGDFVYIDPPYFPVSKYSDFTRYTKEKFYKQDQERLKEAVDMLDKRGCKVMLSNSDCDFIRVLYRSYTVHKVYSARTLNADKAKRGKIPELVIRNYSL